MTEIQEVCICMSTGYEISKGVSGKTVKYVCQACGSKLINPLSQAGHEDYCPDCSEPHVVPGVREQEAEATRRVQAQKAKQSTREYRQEASREAVRSKVAAKAKRDRKLTLDRDPLIEWVVYLLVIAVVIVVVAGRHIMGAVLTDSSGMCLTILLLFAIGLTLNLRGVYQLRNEYVCAAICLNAMRQPTGLRDLIQSPAAGVFHQHIKDLAAIARHDSVAFPRFMYQSL